MVNICEMKKMWGGEAEQIPWDSTYTVMIIIYQQKFNIVTTFGDLLFLPHFLLLSPQTKFGDLLFLLRFLLLLLLLLFFFFLFFSLRFCPTKFSETDDSIFTKLHRKVDLHLKRGIQVLEFSKWPPFQKGHQYKD